MLVEGELGTSRAGQRAAVEAVGHEGAVVVDAHEAAALRDGLELVVREVARVAAYGTAVGVARHEGAARVREQVPEAGVVEVRDVRHDAELLHAAHRLDAKGREALRGRVARAHAVLAVPGERDHLDAVGRHLVENFEPVLERGGVLDREHRRDAASCQRVLHLPAVAHLGELRGVRRDLVAEVGGHPVVERVRREPRARKVVRHPHREALAPGPRLSHALERELQAVVQEVRPLRHARRVLRDGPRVMHGQAVQRVAVQVEYANAILCGHGASWLAWCCGLG